MPLRRATPALLAAGGCVVALVAVWAAAFRTSGAHGLDVSALHGFLGLQRPRTEPVAGAIAHLADPLPLGLLAAALVLVALARGRPRLALAVPAVLLGANVTTQILKPALAQPRVCDCLGDQLVAAASWPSGHATASMSLTLCAVLVAPPRLRPTAAVVGCAFALGVSYGLLTLGWHYPSDVLGGYLVAALYTFLAIAALHAPGARWPARTGREAAARWGAAVAPVGMGALFVALPAAAIVSARPREVVAYAAAHTTFVAVAAVLAATAATVAGGFAFLLRR
jgi:membrane-associated phospholipid phosphatase